MQSAHRVRLSYRIAERLNIQVGWGDKNQIAEPRGLPRCRADGVEAVPPKDRSNRQPAANSPGLNEPGYRTAEQRGLPRCRADGVEAVPPKDGNSR